MPISKPKVLFFAEGATLAHVARPLVLARALDRSRFVTILARPKAFQWLTTDAPFRVRELPCQDGAVFAHRLEHGLPLYDYATLMRYVEDDLALIDSEKPDVIVGDFRLSLSVSARLRSIPYISICDAYWSPEQTLDAPLPVLRFTRFTPIPLAKLIFRSVSNLALRIHAAPLEQLRARYGLLPLGHDLRRCYTDADLRLFANFPALFPNVKISQSAAFIGPIAWSPENTLALDFTDKETPLIYVTMGSSGNPHLLEKIIPILEQGGNQIMVASAGKPISLKTTSTKTRVFDYLPGNIICQHAKLVICNGGSPTTNQALANGIPVLGIAQNMDQFLNMQAIEKFGAGLIMRADRTSERCIRNTISELMSNVKFTERANLLAGSLTDGLPKIDDFIDQALYRPQTIS